MVLTKMVKKVIHFLWLKKKYYFYKNIIKNEFKNSHGSKRVILLGSPEHENIGDHAISIAERLFVKEKLSEYSIVEITNNSCKYAGRYLKKFVNDDDMIMITGGGLMGSIWPEEEEMITGLINLFYKNKIIIMPQTIYFAQNDYSRTELINLKRAIDKCNRIVIMCRDSFSYTFAKENLPAKIYYMPDMVMYLKDQVNPKIRNGIGLCFRADKESCLNDNTKNNVISEVSKLGELKSISTVAPYHIPISNRDKEINRILNEISSIKLLVTDRLHAMLFAFITKTPCIAFNNLSNKVSGVYQWISDCNFIICVNSEQEFNEALNKLSKLKKIEFNYQQLDNRFDEMADIIKK